jgi:hypothetical protein
VFFSSSDEKIWGGKKEKDWRRAPAYMEVSNDVMRCEQGHLHAALFVIILHDKKG